MSCGSQVLNATLRWATLGLHDEAGHVSGGTVVGQEVDNSTLIPKLRGALVATVDSAGMLFSASVPPHVILLYFPFLGSVNIYPPVNSWTSTLVRSPDTDTERVSSVVGASRESRCG